MGLGKTLGSVGSRIGKVRNGKIHNLYLLYITNDYMEEDEIDRTRSTSEKQYSNKNIGLRPTDLSKDGKNRFSILHITRLQASTKLLAGYR